MDSLFSTLKELATPRTWSLGVELARTADFHEERSQDENERIFSIVRGSKDSIVRVNISPADDVWQCDCGSEEDPCSHVIGTVIAIRTRGDSLTRNKEGAPGVVEHHFTRIGDTISFSRTIRFGEERVPVQGSLAGSIERIGRSGRSRVVGVTEDELSIDHVLTTSKEGVLTPKVLRHLLPALSRVSQVFFEEKSVSVSSQIELPTLSVGEEGTGYRVRSVLERPHDEIFLNGVGRFGDTLFFVDDGGLTAEEWRNFSGKGAFFSADQELDLATRVLPGLAGRIKITYRSQRLPRARAMKPRIVVETISDEGRHSLTVVPRIVYGDPPIAEVVGKHLNYLSRRDLPIRDPVTESTLSRELLQRYGLSLNQAKHFREEQAVMFLDRIKGLEARGEGKQVFTPAAELAFVVEPLQGGGTEGVETFVFADSSGNGPGAKAQLEDVLTAYQRGQTFVRLVNGEWGKIPQEWLAVHSNLLGQILAASQRGESPPPRLIPEIVDACTANGAEAPEYMRRIASALKDRTDLPPISLPADFTGELREYQKEGVRWLGFLRSVGIGALLADDMGLGKTIQAMAVLSGRSLVVLPTSVLRSWESQLATFRPHLRVVAYHGPNRVFPKEWSSEDGEIVVLTTYAIVRIEQERLSGVEWDAIVVDEAQTIRNPASQVSQAVHSLRAKWKVCLSGTPVENSLFDLWSQLSFLNPGLLGSRSEFEESFVRPIESGSAGHAEALKKRATPFILRRLKRDVAKELPPKTEVVLQCELSADERAVYDALLASTRADLIASTGEEVNAFSVLEMLLRLRQSCCHSALVPGCEAKTSSKVQLLLESITTSRMQGHRALIFSQWTSFLDLIEPHLRQEGVRFSRIDGSTVDRGRVVDEFQGESGPDVMLLSLKAGGVGITLTAADHVYIVDPWWNPAVEDQASDRAHRIGQENPVVVYRLVAKDTVEERVMELQVRKRGLLDAALRDGRSVGISREEVLGLLE